MRAGYISRVLQGLLISLFIVGCSSRGASTSPVTPPSDLSSDQSQVMQLNDNPKGHSLWGYYQIIIDPEDLSAEILPLRDVAAHWNVLTFLENGPCTNCLKIVKGIPTADGSLLIDIEIRHPFPSPNFTGFDVRGIAMFDSGEHFYYMGLETPDRSSGNGELLNADGYTTLYNGSTTGSGPGGLQGYSQGRFAGLMMPDSDLNGYKRHISDDPANTRNAFYAGDSVTATYEIVLPEMMFIFGYAVDANWEPPVSKPVDDPMEDFGPGANCPEPWKIDVTEEPIGDGLTSEGGQTKLIIDVYDRQGKDTNLAPVVECDFLFQDLLTAEWVEDGVDYARYEVTIENTFHYGAAIVKCLVAVEDIENETAPEWLDLTAYQIINLTVKGPPIAAATADPNPQSVGDPVTLSGAESSDPDGGEITLYEWDVDNDGTYDETGIEIQHTWNTPGTYSVQLRITDDDGMTDELNYPLQVQILEEGIPVAPVDVTPAGLNFLGSNVAYSDGYAFLASYANGMQVFDVSNPSNPVWVAEVPTICDAVDIAVQGNYAYVSGECCGLYIIDISHPESPQLVKTVEGFESTDLAVSDLYAYSVGENFGLDIIDIDPPTSAHSVRHYMYVNPAFFATDIAYWNGLVCIAGQFDGTMIVDVSPPADTHEVKIIGDFWSAVEAVAAKDGYAYAGDFNNGFQVIDIDPPEDAEVKHSIPLSDYCYNMEIAGNYIYAPCLHWGVKVLDISDPESMFEAATIETGGGAYGIDVYGQYAYVADGHKGLTVMDIDPLSGAYVVGNADTVGHSEDIEILGDYAYIADYSGDLTVVDINPPESAHIVHTLELPGSMTDISIEGNYAYGIANCLNIMSLGPSGTADFVHTVDLDGDTRSLAVANGYAYVVAKEGYSSEEPGFLYIIDVDPPGGAYVVKTIDVCIEPEDVAVSGGYAYIAGTEGPFPSDEGVLQIVDVSPPTGAFINNTVIMPAGTYAVAILGDYAYVGGWDYGLQIVDISTPGSEYIAHSVESYGEAYRLALSGGYTYFINNNMEIYDIDPPLEAFKLCQVLVTGRACNADFAGDYAFIAAGSGGLRVLRLW